MTIVKMELPECDICGKVWLPDENNVHQGISARQDPRRYDAVLRSEGKALRCGKCKSPKWDWKFKVDQQKRSSHPVRGAKNSKRSPAHTEQISNAAGLEKLYGILSETYAELGGGEAYLKAERNWGLDVWERYEQEKREHKGHCR